MYVIEIDTPLGINVVLTDEYFERIKRKHKEVHEIKIGDVMETLSHPDFVMLDQKDPSVFLYNKLILDTPYGPKILVVVVKHLKERGFIITIYLSSKIKKGRIVWTRK